MANYVPLICYDFETGGKYPTKSQVTSLSAVAIDPVRLEIIKDSEFNTYVKCVLDPKECESLGIEPLQDEAMNITGIKIEDLEKAPSIQEVWKRFEEHVNKYTNGTGKWNKPIPIGYNILNFDNIITGVLCKKYGPWDKERECQDLFHPRDTLDVMHISWNIFERDKSTRSISFDTMRTYLGLSKEGAHSSLVDVQQTAMFYIRWQTWLRKSLPKNLKGSMANCKIEDFYDTK